MKQLIISIKMLVVMTVLLGIIYPLFITGIAQLAFPSKANGSLVSVNGMVKGSQLIGQKMDSPLYFNPRPSATDYNTLPSGASNLGLTNEKLYRLVQARKAAIIATDSLSKDAIIPSDLLFASASGLDPHISPEAARLQIERIAKARGFSTEQKQQLKTLVNNFTESPQFGILGCARVNVFLLNLELDKMK